MKLLFFFCFKNLDILLRPFGPKTLVHAPVFAKNFSRPGRHLARPKIKIWPKLPNFRLQQTPPPPKDCHFQSPEGSALQAFTKIWWNLTSTNVLLHAHVFACGRFAASFTPSRPLRGFFTPLFCKRPLRGLVHTPFFRPYSRPLFWIRPLRGLAHALFLNAAASRPSSPALFCKPPCLHPLFRMRPLRDLVPPLSRLFSLRKALGCLAKKKNNSQWNAGDNMHQQGKRECWLLRANARTKNVCTKS